MVATRDPVSVPWDAAARRLLDRCYAAPGTWQATRLADPTPAQLAWAASLGINLNGRDNPSTATRRGGLNARSRWARAFVRSVNYQHRYYSKVGRGGGWRDDRARVARASYALQVEVGRALPARGVIPAGRAVRVKLHQGGQRADQAAARKSDADRYITDDGGPGGRVSSFDRRDW